MSFWMGTPESFEQRSTLNPQQQNLFSQLIKATQSQGAGGAFGDAADYYRGLLGNDSEDMDAFAAPELRRFNQETIPGLAEQFAGMGSGGLSSSGFRNAAVNAGSDLTERLAAMRASLRQNAASGLQQLGQQGLQNVSQNVYRPRQPGFLESAAPAFGTAVGTAIGGPIGGAIGGGLGQLGSSFLGKFGQSSPYGNAPTQGNPNPYKHNVPGMMNASQV